MWISKKLALSLSPPTFIGPSEAQTPSSCYMRSHPSVFHGNSGPPSDAAGGRCGISAALIKSKNQSHQAAQSLTDGRSRRTWQCDVSITAKQSSQLSPFNSKSTHAVIFFFFTPLQRVRCPSVSGADLKFRIIIHPPDIPSSLKDPLPLLTRNISHTSSDSNYLLRQKSDDVFIFLSDRFRMRNMSQHAKPMNANSH